MLRKGLDETDVLIAVGLALNTPIAEIAALIGKTEGTVYKRRQMNQDGIEKIRAGTAQLASLTFERRIKAMEAKTDIKGRISEKAYKRLERLLERDEDDFLTLGALKEGLDRSEGKSLDRKAILQRNEQAVEIQMSPETEARLALLDRLIPQYQRLYLPPMAQEAETS